MKTELTDSLLRMRKSIQQRVDELQIAGGDNPYIKGAVLAAAIMTSVIGEEIVFLDKQKDKS